MEDNQNLESNQQPANSPEPNNNFRIIIIDDNPQIHKDFIKILVTKQSTAIPKALQLEKELFGDQAESTSTPDIALPFFQIDTATQGQEGVTLIKKAFDEGHPYALAFVDVRMPPGWDGIETIKHIWAIDPNIQVVICTAYSDYTWEQTIAALGKSDNLLILKKPFDNVAVRQLAFSLTKKWQLLQESKERTQVLEGLISARTASLQRSLSLTRATIESSSDGILVVDNQDGVVDYNQKFVEIWGISESVLALKSKQALFEYIVNQIEEPTDFLNKIKALDTEPGMVHVSTYPLKNGQVIECYSQPHKLNNQDVGRVWSFHNITKRVTLEKKLEYQATHDALTGLPNRLLLADRISQAIASANRNKMEVGVLFFDVDRFKLINDSLSHEAGDELLKALANKVQAALRSVDTLARLGGDEFIVVAPDVQPQSLITLSNRILTMVREPLQVAGNELNITVSIGVSVYPKDGKTIDELLRCADLAMYRAKEAGRNQTQFYTKELNQENLHRLEKETELHNAVVKHEFFVLYQPQFDLISKKITAVEALVRWQHPTKGLILPMDFIPLAEETGMIVPLGDWVMKTACAQNKKWQDEGLPPMKIAVNVATKQFKQLDFIEKVRRILDETGLKPEYLEVEVTENVIIGNATVLSVIGKLRELGVTVSLDDFGTGTSSLSHLREVAINALKIDETFIRNIGLKHSDEILIQAIVGMAKGLELDVVAEGVTTPKQIDFLKTLQCEHGQGFYFSKAVSSEEIEQLLKNPESITSYLPPDLNATEK